MTGLYVAGCYYPRIERAVCSLAGLVSALSIIFCGLLQPVKWLPRCWAKNKLQSTLNDGHPWVGLLAIWTAILHMKFRIFPEPRLNYAVLLYYAFVVVALSGLYAFYFRHLLILKSSAKGGDKKELAGSMISLGYDGMLGIHDKFHVLLYPLLFFHVLGYFIYGRFW